MFPGASSCSLFLAVGDEGVIDERLLAQDGRLQVRDVEESEQRHQQKIVFTINLKPDFDRVFMKKYFFIPNFFLDEKSKMDRAYKIKVYVVPKSKCNKLKLSHITNDDNFLRAYYIYKISLLSRRNIHLIKKHF